MKEDRIGQRDFYARERERNGRRGTYPRAGAVLICSRKLLTLTFAPRPEPCLPFLCRCTPPLDPAYECPSTPKVLHWHRLWPWSSSSARCLAGRNCSSTCFEHFHRTTLHARSASKEVVSWTISHESVEQRRKCLEGSRLLDDLPLVIALIVRPASLKLSTCFWSVSDGN